MPIQIPSLNRSDTSLRRTAQGPPESVGRLSDQVPDGEHDMQLQTQATVGAADALTQYQEKVNTDAAHVVATGKTNEYRQWVDQQIEGDKDSPGIKYNKGDPTPLWKKFNDDNDAKFQEITNDPSLSGMAKRLTLESMTNAHSQTELRSLSESGNQQNNFAVNVYKSGQELNKNQLIDDSSHIKAGQPSTFQPFDKTVGDIRTNVINEAIRNGSAHLDENGEHSYIDANGTPQRVSLDPAAKVDMINHLGDGVYRSIDNAVKSNNPDVAQAIQDKYGSFMAAQDKTKLAGEFQAMNNRVAGAKAINATQNLDPDQVESYIQRQPIALQGEIRKAVNDNQRQVQDMAERASKQSYDTIVNQLQPKVDRGEITTSTQIRNNPFYINMISDVTDPKQREVIESLADNRKVSAPGAQKQFLDSLTGAPGATPLKGMPSSDLLQITSQMTKSEATDARTKWEQVNSETNPQQSERYKLASVAMEKQLNILGIVSKNPVFQHYSPEDQNFVDQAKAQMVKELSAAPSGPMTPKEIEDFAESSANGFAKGQVFNYPNTPRYAQAQAKLDASRGVKVANNNTPPPMTQGQVNAQALKRLRVNIQNPSPQELQQYVEKHFNPTTQKWND